MGQSFFANIISVSVTITRMLFEAVGFDSVLNSQRRCLPDSVSFNLLLNSLYTNVELKRSNDVFRFR